MCDYVVLDKERIYYLMYEPTRLYGVLFCNNKIREK